MEQVVVYGIVLPIVVLAWLGVIAVAYAIYDTVRRG